MKTNKKIYNKKTVFQCCFGQITIFKYALGLRKVLQYNTNIVHKFYVDSKTKTLQAALATLILNEISAKFLEFSDSPPLIETINLESHRNKSKNAVTVRKCEHANFGKPGVIRGSLLERSAIFSEARAAVLN